MNYQVHADLVSLKSNLIDLPPSLANNLSDSGILPQDVILELNYTRNGSTKTTKNYCGWSGNLTSKNDKIAIDAIFASSLRLTSTTPITLVPILTGFHYAKQIIVQPTNYQDWQMLESNTFFLENNILSQTRVVKLGQILVVYPSSTQYTKLKIVKIDSLDLDNNYNRNFYTKLSSDCEIIISPPPEKSSQDSVASRATTAAKPVSKEFSTFLRGIGLPHKLCDVPETPNYEIYTSFENLRSRSKYVSVSVVREIGSQIGSQIGDGENSETELTPTVKIVAKVVYFAAPSNHIFLSSVLSTALGIETGSLGEKILVQQATHSLASLPNLVTVHPYVKKHDLVLNKQTSLARELGVYINELTHVSNYTKLGPIPTLLPLGGILTFNKERESWIRLKKKIKVEIGGGVDYQPKISEESRSLKKLIGVDEITGKLVDSYSLNQKASSFGIGANNYLIHGSSGVGKSHLLRVLTNELSNKGIYIKRISMTNSMTTDINAMKKTFGDWFVSCVWRTPSILMIDDMDKLLSCEQENSDNLFSNHLSEYFISLVQMFRVPVIMTSIAKESLNKVLFQSHVIENTLHLTPPDKNMRIEYIKSYVQSLCVALDNELLMEIVNESEGYLIKDLKVLVDRMYQEVLIDDGNSINKEVFKRASLGYTPSNLRGIKLQKSSTSWTDIGGLGPVKRVLLETLEWPTKYQPIFSQSPLRLRSGILLYGYPGCGKTLMASAISGQFGLNFISVKGPEILNKYIGSSEQTIRELFDKAQAAKPCILFFDEFDSIAPKRGHDSTGVTDRVVNQLLTQMDGAEGLEGVYVLAATSRPDLIDSALLRPGRLDKSILCDLPDVSDRLNILETVTKKLNLESSIDLSAVAQQTEGFSGADLQGLSYNAYLKSVHEFLNNGPDLVQTKKVVEFFNNFKINKNDRLTIMKKVESLVEQGEGAKHETSSSIDEIQINLAHFNEAVGEMKPSISQKEKNKLQRIYNAFVNDRDGNMPDGEASMDIGGRTTLM